MAIPPAPAQAVAKKVKVSAPVTVLRHRNGRGSGEYPIFERFALQCENTDGYWAHFFRSLVNSKFPKGVSIKDNFVIYRNKRKTAKILEIPPPEEWEILANFFRENCEIMSSRDWDVEKDKEKDMVVSLTTAQLNIRKRKERISTIPAYVLEMSKKHDLTPSEMLDLENVIRYHFNARTFRDGDVIYGPNGNIKEITAVEFDEENRRFVVTREPRASREARENYIPTLDYLFGRVTIKKLEKKLSFDDEMKRYLKLVYGTLTVAGTSDTRSVAEEPGEVVEEPGE